MIRRLIAALVAAFVAAVAFVFAVASIAAVNWDPQLAVTSALGAVFVPQSLIVGVWLGSPRRGAGESR
ncbi:hypothetical protein [Micromonospora profundi]|uniref:hypothetical protein n=1 Tax=Micromonospora profundi TaxID=1420889 RepID=UPI003650BAC4